MASFTHAEVLEATRGTSRGTAPAAFTAISTDTRTIAPGSLFVALKGDVFDAHDFIEKAATQGAAGAVVRRGVAVKSPPGFCLIEVDDTLHALGALAKFHRRRFDIPLGAVGGSNGKTTTKEMVGAILQARGPSLKTEGNLNNEVGVPLTLLKLTSEHTAAVIEMGMNHPGELDRLSRIGHADAAIITSIGAEHLEGLGSLEAVADAEGEIFRGLKIGGLAIVNADDALSMAQATRSGRSISTFGSSEHAEVRLLRIVSHDIEGLRIQLLAGGHTYELHLGFVGEHNALNACGAFAMGIALGCSPSQCIAGLGMARPFAHRLELHPLRAGWTVVDDCYNANPASMDAALATLRQLAPDHRRVAILGDMLELGAHEEEEHRKLGALAVQSKVQMLVSFGPRSRFAHEAAAALGDGRLHAPEIGDVTPVVKFLEEHLRKGDVVLVKGSRGMKLERVVEALTGKKGGAH